MSCSRAYREHRGLGIFITGPDFLAVEIWIATRCLPVIRQRSSSNEADLFASNIHTKFCLNCLRDRYPIRSLGFKNLHLILSVNKDELERQTGDNLIRVLGASIIPESTFIDLSGEGTVTLLTGLNNSQNRNLEVIGDLGFEFSESTFFCDGGAI